MKVIFRTRDGLEAVDDVPDSIAMRGKIQRGAIKSLDTIHFPLKEPSPEDSGFEIRTYTWCGRNKQGVSIFQEE
jgi:hypothetical protein